MIKFCDVQFGYNGKNVLENIDLSIEPGQFIGIVGPNGSGKTTLLRLITGFLQPISGKVFLHNKEIKNYTNKQRAQLMSVVSQNYLVNPHFTVEKLLQLGREPYLGFLKRLGKKDQRLIDNAIGVLQLKELKGRTAKTLSGGELQRTIIAKALVQDTPIIIMDEPVNHLDIHYQTAILDIIKGLNREGKTVITVLHDLNLALKYSTRLLVLNGRVAAYGKPMEVLDQNILREVFHADDFELHGQRVVLK